ncbi:MAG: hypothetical protein U1F50_16155 [Rubrivivax sp.]
MHQPDHWIAASRSPFGLLGNACAQAHRHDREPVAQAKPPRPRRRTALDRLVGLVTLGFVPRP